MALKSKEGTTIVYLTNKLYLMPIKYYFQMQTYTKSDYKNELMVYIFQKLTFNTIFFDILHNIIYIDYVLKI